MRKRPLVLLAGLALVVVAIVFGRMVFQPGPYDFAGGEPVPLASYAAAAPDGVPVELATASLVARGEYITRMADCEACHTAKDGQRFAGGRPFVLPFGTIFTPNITPDPQTGIGKWTDAQFLAAVHEGRAPDGSNYYPAFPYATYTLMSEADVLAIKAYLFSLRPVRQPLRGERFSFPFNQRWLMKIWGGLFNADERFRPIPQRSAAWNRGAYLVEAAGHCGDCHTPRNLLQALDQRRKFTGGAAEGWNAYNITSEPMSGIGAWSDQELIDYLSKGHARSRGTASGPMHEVFELSLAHLQPSDLTAMATYLRSVPALTTPGAVAPAGPAPVSPRTPATTNAIGKRIFEASCASCHAWNGSGAMVERARLTQSRAVNDPTGANAAMIVLHGSGHSGQPGAYMPAFARSHSDAEVAAVINYVTERFGARPSKLDAQDIAEMRKH